MTDFKTQLASVAAQVETALDGFLPVPEGEHAVVVEAMRYAALNGGKRLRPFLVIETARMLGGDLDNAMTVGCSLECLHVYSLIHDDLPCMDDDDLRRGRPTVGKATFVSLLGLQEAKDMAKELGETAKMHLASFGDTADTLKETVDFVLQRQH